MNNFVGRKTKTQKIVLFLTKFQNLLVILSIFDLQINIGISLSISTGKIAGFDKKGIEIY